MTVIRASEASITILIDGKAITSPLESFVVRRPRFFGWSAEAILNTRNAQAAWRGRMHATSAGRGR